MRYVLITAAHNEDKFIERTIQSVIKQTVLPSRWIIVSDCSTDQTDSIVKSYALTYEFIQLHRMERPHDRNFAAQVNAINTGYELVKPLEFELVGNLDADLSFDEGYFEEMLRRFKADPRLGLAGGWIQERRNGVFSSRPGNRIRSVPHAVQLFRRSCFERMGGYTPLPYGGPDWLAEIVLREDGWIVRSYPDLPVMHYRPTSSANGILRGRYHDGKQDYSVGTGLIFETLKCAKRLLSRPIAVGALAQLAGFMACYVRHQPRSVGPQIVNALRADQRSRLRFSLKGNCGRPKIREI